MKTQDWARLSIMNFVKPANSNPVTRTSFDHSWSCPNSSTFVQFDCCHILADVTWHLCNFNHDFLQCLNAITTQTKSFLVDLSIPNYYVKCSLLLCNLLWSSLPYTQLTHVQIQNCSSNGLAGTSFLQPIAMFVNFFCLGMSHCTNTTFKCWLSKKVLIKIDTL